MWLVGSLDQVIEVGAVLRPTQPEQVTVVTTCIEAAIRAAVPHIDRVLVHAEPDAGPLVRVAVPLAEQAGRLSEHFGSAPFFAIVDVDRFDGSIQARQDLFNPYLGLDGRRAA